MRKKLKKICIILLILFVTLACIALGFKTRYDARIKITQIKNQEENKHANCYMLETDKSKIVMIDGGTKADATYVEEKIKEKGGVVDYWFITNIAEKNFGVLNDILKNRDDITVNNIIVSLNSEEWYFENCKKDAKEIKEFLDILKDKKVALKVHETALREEFKLDNLNFKILKVKEPDILQNAEENQGMVIKADNMFKDVLFLSSIGKETEKNFVDNNLDEIEVYCAVLPENSLYLNAETYEKMNAKIYLNNCEDCTNKNENLYTEIW